MRSSTFGLAGLFGAFFFSFFFGDASACRPVAFPAAAFLLADFSSAAGLAGAFFGLLLPEEAAFVALDFFAAAGAAFFALFFAAALRVVVFFFAAVLRVVDFFAAAFLRAVRPLLLPAFFFAVLLRAVFFPVAFFLRDVFFFFAVIAGLRGPAVTALEPGRRSPRTPRPSLSPSARDDRSASCALDEFTDLTRGVRCRRV